ncbi:hypothetical protein [Nannocystis sp.]|uniref:hypothetical protein n=1 Tax=Nannocystis sp. TaxID=1962667 RepID=UPI0025D7FD3D|nr:hypothetical protein [Nannocystis sp.]MBK7825459.1 hypothetical protein [Nannocystis sp.]
MASEVRDEWQAAIDFGIDVTLLEENLRRTPAERFRRLNAINKILHEVEIRTVPEDVRDRRAAEELVAKFGDLLKYAAP